MSEPPTIAAVGHDFGRYVPGVFWLNFFGRRYRNLIGEDRLRAAPVEEVTAADDGVLMVLPGGPTAWDTPEYAISEHQLRAHLGPELFFSKAEPDRLTVAPDWEN